LIKDDILGEGRIELEKLTNTSANYEIKLGNWPGTLNVRLHIPELPAKEKPAPKPKKKKMEQDPNQEACSSSAEIKDCLEQGKPFYLVSDSLSVPGTLNPYSSYQ